MAVSGEGKQDLRGVSRLKPAEVDDREDIPLTCLLHLWLNGIRGSPPPPGALTRPPPAPYVGAGKWLEIGPMAVPWRA